MDYSKLNQNISLACNEFLDRHVTFIINKHPHWSVSLCSKSNKL